MLRLEMPKRGLLTGGKWPYKMHVTDGSTLNYTTLQYSTVQYRNGMTVAIRATHYKIHKNIRIYIPASVQ